MFRSVVLCNVLAMVAVLPLGPEARSADRPPQYPTLTVTTWTITEQPVLREVVTESVVTFQAPAQVTTTEKRGPFGRVREKSTTVAPVPVTIQQRTPLIQAKQVFQVHEVGACGSPSGRPATVAFPMWMSAPRTFRGGGG